jgi:imidazolonepropionase-like amidohydrolase
VSVVLDEDRPVAVIADRLVDGTGRDPVAAAAVVISGGRITACGPRSSLSIPADARIVEGDDLTVLPGLMDMHVHVGMPAGMDFTRMLMTPRSFALLHAIPNCASTLHAGVTTVRDAGLSPVGIRLAIERGFFPGPHMQMAVSILSQTGGHGDATMPCGCNLPFDAGLDIPSGVVDGVEAMRHKAREVLRAGADWIKLCTSGGVLSANDAVNVSQFTVEEIAVAVYEAAAQHRSVMSHAMSASGIKNAVIGGVRSIEHGCLIDEEAIALMKRHGVFLVPTLKAPEDVIAGAERKPGTLPEAMVDKSRSVMEQHRRGFRAAVEAGVRVAMGTDSAVGPHGENLRELALMVANGMSPMQAIVASTRSCAELLGIDTTTGTLEPGKTADVVTVQGDPLADIALFDDPGRVHAVIKAGVLVSDRTGVRASAGVG